MGAGALAERRFRSRDLFGALLDLLLVLLELLRDIVCGFASGLDWALVACGRLVFALLFGLLGSSLSLGRERLSYPCDRGPTSPLTSVRSGVGAPARTAAFPLLTNTQWTITARPANVGLNPDFEHRTRGLRVFIDMTKDTNVVFGLTNRRLIIVATGMGGAPKSDDSISLEGLEVAERMKKEFVLEWPDGRVHVRGAAKQMLPDFLDQLSARSAGAGN